jgi:hypothetical protein
MGRFLASMAFLALAGCVVGQPASSFTPEGADAAAEASHGDAGNVPETSLVGDGGGPQSFACGPTFCPTTTYCLITLTEAGAEAQEDCYPPVQCDAGDCACIEGVVAASYCDGGHVTCTATTGVVATCTP